MREEVTMTSGIILPVLLDFLHVAGAQILLIQQCDDDDLRCTRRYPVFGRGEDAREEED